MAPLHALLHEASRSESFPVDPVVERTSGLLALLSARKLDRTLTSVAPAQPREMAPFLSETLTARLGGGMPRGQVSDITGPASSGRTSLAWAALAAATARGEWAALVDTFDRFDPERAAAAGIALPQLLWVRGQALSKTAGALDPAWVPGERAARGPGTLLERTVDRAIKALNLIVQSGVCTFVVLDLIDVPAAGLARVPRSTWLRIQRVIEGSDTVVVLLGSTPVARSAGGVSIVTGVGRRETGVGRRETGIESRETGDERRETGDGRRESGVGSRATGVGALVADADRPRVRWKGTHVRSRRLGGLATGLRASSARGFVGETALLVG